MGSSSHEESRRKRLGLGVDIGLPVGLLLALITVLIIDLNTSKSRPDQIPSVDLVFVLDQRPTMRDLIDSMKKTCLEKAEELKSGGLDCRFAVIPFGRQRNGIPAVPLTGDLATFKQRLMASPAAGGAQPAASSVEALEEALAMDFREDTPVLFFLISKAPCREDSEVAEIAGRMDERGITTIIQADAAQKDHCLPLYRNGGRFFSMEGDDLTGPIAASSKADKNSSRAENLLARLAPETQNRAASQLVKVKGIFALRTAPDRAELIARLGGSPESELAVGAGLAWLARHQAEDGHWSDQGMCEPEQRCPGRFNYRATVAETGLAILAFQAGGNYYFNDQKYSGHVTRGLEWLVKQQKEDGRLFGPVKTWYEHGMATFALAEACAVALANDRQPDPRYLNAAERAVEFMERHQYQRGGWQYSLDSSGLGDSSVTGWQVLALKSALEAKIDVSPDTMDRVQKFFEGLGDPRTGRTGYQSRGGGTDLTTAVGLIVQQFILKQPKSPLARKAVEHLGGRADAGIGRAGDFYTLYNATLAMFLAGGDAWKQWNRQVRDAVVERQEKIGCARGSWHHRYGRTLDTAWAVLTLEVYYRYATEQEEGDDEDSVSE